ncbi:unnamed protein product [Calypogeia fissa]
MPRAARSCMDRWMKISQNVAARSAAGRNLEASHFPSSSLSSDCRGSGAASMQHCRRTLGDWILGPQ